MTVSEGGEARNHEEVEAVARVLWDDAEARFAHGERSNGRQYTTTYWAAADIYDRAEYIHRAEKVIAALTAVRSSGSAAQNHEGPQLCDACGKHLEQHLRKQGDFPCSPQGEGHEAAWREFWRVLRERGNTIAPAENFYATKTIEQALGAYRAALSRCPSPERNTEKEARLVEALRRLVELKDRPDHDRIHPAIKREAWQDARTALAEFGSVVPADDKASEPSTGGG